MALSIAPGPDNIFVLMQSVAYGKKYGLIITLGLISGILIHTTLVAFGVSVIIKESDLAFFIIKLSGALYLFYLAFKVFKSKEEIDLSKNTTPKKKPLNLFKLGFIMNVLNPKVTIFFMAFFPGFLFSNELSTVVQFYILGGLFMLQALSIFGLIAILAGSISEYLKRNTVISHILRWMQILVFIAIGLFILLSEK